MYRKSIFSLATTILLLIVVSAHLLSCSDVDDEEVTERLQFTEFFLFPTAPYINKSYREHVPDEEVASLEKDFSADIAAIQAVYSAFIKALTEKDRSALQKTFDTAQGAKYAYIDEFGRRSVGGWSSIRAFIQANWSHPTWNIERVARDSIWGEPTDWQLTDFYIRGAHIKRPYMEARATGPMFYYDPGHTPSYIAIGRFYLTKKTAGKPTHQWRIHQIDGEKYFTDPKYKVD